MRSTAVGVQRLPRSKVERTFLKPREIEALLGAADNVLDSTILALFAYTGMRRGEGFAVQWRDVNTAHQQIAVQRSIVGKIIGTPKTRNSVRRVDVPERLLGCLAIYRVCYPPIGDGFLFRTEDGRPLDPDCWFKAHFARILARAEGVRPCGSHALRHSYGSLLISAGESLLYVSRQLGHASIQITCDVYGHLLRESSTAAMKRLDARLSGTGAQVISIRTGTKG